MASITQPAVSNALKRLKDSLGEELLTRTAFGVKPTARAQALCNPQRQWKELVQVLRALPAHPATLT